VSYSTVTQWNFYRAGQYIYQKNEQPHPQNGKCING